MPDTDWRQSVIEYIRAEARPIHKIGRDSRHPTFSTVVPFLQKAVDDLPPKLRLRSARLLAAERVNHLQSLIAAVHTMAGRLLY
jgi:hypothetical protein